MSIHLGITTEGPDGQSLMTAYESLRPEEKLQGRHSTPVDFLAEIQWRIYTEWCCGEGMSKDHSRYQGKAFQQWVTDETHFAMERAGFTWDKERGHFHPDDEAANVYAATRANVVRAIALRASEFFHATDERRVPKKGDPLNLRSSLEPNMERATAMGNVEEAA